MTEVYSARILVESWEQEAGSEEMVQSSTPVVCRGEVQGTEESAETVVCYKEPAESGLGEGLTTLRVTPDQVILERGGPDAGMQLVFREGETTRSDYQTPYGTLELETRTTGLVLREQDQGMQVELDYSIRIGGAEETRRHLRIDIDPDDKLEHE